MRRIVVILLVLAIGFWIYDSGIFLKKSRTFNAENFQSDYYSSLSSVEVAEIKKADEHDDLVRGAIALGIDEDHLEASNNAKAALSEYESIQAKKHEEYRKAQEAKHNAFLEGTKQQ